MLKDNYTVRWLRRRDLPGAIRIECESFPNPWTEDDMLACLRQRNCIGLVAIRSGDGAVAGYAFYEIAKQQLRLLNIAVAPECRRQGVATLLVNTLKNKLQQQRREILLLEVRESNLDAQLFFRAQGFTATGVLRGHFPDVGEDAYAMRYQPKRLAPVNRISAYIGGEAS